MKINVESVSTICVSITSTSERPNPLSSADSQFPSFPYFKVKMLALLGKIANDSSVMSLKRS